MEVKLLLGGLGSGGDEYGQDLAWLNHEVRFCGASDAPCSPQSLSLSNQRQDVACGLGMVVLRYNFEGP